MTNSCIYESPLGILRLSEKKGFLIQVSFVEKFLESDVFLKNLKLSETNVLKKTSNRLDEYFSGQLEEFNIPLKINGTVFQNSAWRALSRIPYGETWSYFKQAKFIKNPNAIRAVGYANSKNPIPIIIPCHRVISKDGSLAGYSGGIQRKSYLIELEKKFRHAHNY